MKKVLTSLAVLMGVVFVAILVVVMYVSHASRDIPEPDVSSLFVDRPDVAAEDNAFTYFSAATNSFYWPTNSLFVRDYLGVKPVDSSLVREVITRNEAMLAKGLACEICLAPEVTDYDSLLPYIPAWMDIGKIMALKARYERLAGNCAAATDTCIAQLRFADLIQNTPECTVNYYVGIAVLEQGLQQARDIAQDDRSSDEDLSKLSTALADLGPFDVGLIRAISQEYKFTANAIDDLSSSTGPLSVYKGRRIPRYLFQPNKTKQAFANLYQDVIKNASLCYAKMDFYDIEEELGLNDSKLKTFTRPNAIGVILYGMLLPATDSLLERKCRAECNVAATRLISASLAYEKKNGRLPEKSSDIVPDYISVMPVDPYDGQAFRCDFASNMVYSVGKDLKDSGGSAKLLAGRDTPRRRLWNAEDIVFSIRKEIEPVAQ